MRIWHFKLRNIRRYAAYLGHWMGDGIWLVIRLGQEIMLTNNVTKFADGPLNFFLSNIADNLGNFG